MLLSACGEEESPRPPAAVAGQGASGGTGGDSAAGTSGTGGTAGTGATTAGGGGVDCNAFVVTGDRTAVEGATWTYQSTDDGVAYSLEGILFAPAGDGPFPGVVINHGKDGTVWRYSALIANEMRSWGMVAIGTMLAHASDMEDMGNLPDGADGRSPENVLRVKKAYDLLTCVPVDMARVAVHGHSMGGFVTGQFLGTHPGLCLAASHTAGGTSMGPNATEMSVAQQIITPYQLHHGDADVVVQYEYDQALADILEASGTPHEFYTYPGFSHEDMTDDPTMFERVRAWYTTYGVLTP